MATKVTNEDVLRINELYYKHKTYAEVARQTGFAASTVKKYVTPGWKPVETKNIVKFDLAQLPDFTTEVAPLFRGIDNYGTMCVYSENEKLSTHKLWEELTI